MLGKWFGKSEVNNEHINPLLVDMHSHFLPGLDDGAPDMETALELIKAMQARGFKKLITTPHIISDFYRNSPQTILPVYQQLKDNMKTAGLYIELEVAAEYYLDDEIMNHLEEGAEMLSFGNNYVLFETNFLSEPLLLKSFIFKLQSRGFRPVLAHPERYLYFYDNIKEISTLIDRGVYMQININSITGHYSKQAQKLAFELIDRKWVHFLGSDCHHSQHLTVMDKAMKHKYFIKALNLDLLNNSLL
ncbi:MAG TPA: capsular biosynthesis protein [Cyclobacteriaceae bacterium]|nr:capsular biosynthesis protein [Cyclobacteriaceae bacterium]